MSLRFKALLLITLMLLLMVAGLYSMTFNLLNSSYERLENEDVQENVDRMQAVFAAEENRLRSIAVSFGMWDATYEFILNRDPNYTAVDLPPQSLVDVQLEFMVFLDAGNQLVHSVLIDHQTYEAIEPPPGFYEQMQAQAALGYPSVDPQSVRSSYMLLPQTMLMVAFTPILRSDRSGDAVGTLVVGQFLDEDELQQFADMTQFSIALTPLYSTDNLPAAIQDALANLSPEHPVYIQKTDPDDVYGYTLLRDSQNRPIGLLDLRLPRTIFQTGQTTMSLILLILLGGGSVAGLLLLLLLERTILRPLTHMAGELAAIKDRLGLGLRVRVETRDEVGQVATNINQLLETLESSQQQQQRLVQQLEQQLNELAEARAREGRFFKHASHEFRTPLTNLTMRLYLLSKSPERMPEHLVVLNSVAAQMRALVEDVFDLARMENGEAPLSLNVICLQDVLTELTARRVQSGMKDLVLDQLPAEEAYVEVDTARLVQALDNLIQFVQDWAVPDQNVRISMLIRSGMVQVRIRVESLRLQGVNRIDVFRPFAYPSEGRVVNTGLGMALAQAIVHQHGGQLSFREENSGGLFTMQLVCVPAPDTRPINVMPA